jgi:predicted phage terminase large subunit-like protein
LNAVVDQADLYRRATATEAELMRREFRLFVKEAWAVVEPGAPYVDGPHIHAIADHLTFCSIGDIDDLLINVPPRHSKSTICAVLWPAWEWTWRPTTQWLFSTYAYALTVRDSVKCRTLITSQWYQERWGEMFKLSGEVNLKERFANNKNGYRLATSVGGATTGEGGDRIVIDDAHNMKDINSDTIREGVLTWWKDVMPTRGNNPKKLSRVVIGQRGHHADLPGHLIEGGGWVHLNLPGYYVPERKCKTYAKKNGPLRHSLRPAAPPVLVDRFKQPLKKGELIWQDWRTDRNEVLSPDRFGPDELRKLSEEMSERSFEAQIQQNPTKSGGNIIKREHWREWIEPELPQCQMVIQFYDTAFEEEEENDFSARTTWGIFEYEESLSSKLPWTASYRGQKRLCAILLERMNERLSFPDLRANAIKSYKEWRPDRIIIEKKASGHSLYQELRRADLPVTRFKVSDSKPVRTHAGSLVYERGCVFYVKRAWAEEVILQTIQFPSAEFDDLHDTCMMMCLWLRRRWDLQYIDETDDDNDINAQLWRGSRKKIYG